MAHLRTTLGGEQRHRWVEFQIDGEGQWRWRRRAEDGSAEEESESFATRDEAEAAAREDPDNSGLEFYVGPSPKHWEQQPLVEMENGQTRRGGRSIPREERRAE